MGDGDGFGCCDRDGDGDGDVLCDRDGDGDGDWLGRTGGGTPACSDGPSFPGNGERAAWPAWFLTALDAVSEELAGSGVGLPVATVGAVRFWAAVRADVSW